MNFHRRIVLKGFFVLFVLWLGALLAWCRLYWGYFFFPPIIDPNVAHMVSIDRVEEYRYSQDAQFSSVSFEIPTNRVDASLGSNPQNRMPLYLLEHGINLPKKADLAQESRRKLIYTLGLGEVLYAGRIYCGQDIQNRKLLVIAGISYPLDHRSYFEAVVSVTSGGELSEVISIQRFNYDSAGLEFLTPSRVYIGGIVIYVGVLIVLELAWLFISRLFSLAHGLILRWFVASNEKDIERR